jgi:hypothetical protein
MGGDEVNQSRRRGLLSVSTGMTTRSKEGALDLLQREKWSSLYLRLPKDWEDAITAIRDGFDFEEVVEGMTELGQVHIPEDAQMLRSWRPFLERMWEMVGERRVRCLMDPIDFDHHRQISLDLASASVKARIGFLDPEEWRQLLEEDMELSLREGEREANLLSDEARDEPACIDLSPESERRLEKVGFHIRRVLIGSVELPLTTLRGEMMAARARNGTVTDERIESGVREHLRFLELLLSSRSFEEACAAWNRRLSNGS